MKAERDIILMLGDGGMMGVFVAGVLHELNKTLRERVHSVYGTSSGADVGVYFVSGQTDIPLRFFTEHLTKREFIRKNFLRYLLKIFFFRNSGIKDYLNVEYVVEVARNSDCELNVDAFQNAEMDFYVKVIEVPSGTASYISAKTNVFEKLKATSQCGPLSTSAIEIDGKRYIDGGILPSDLDTRLAAEHKDKRIIFIQSQHDAFMQKRLLFPLYRLVGHALSILYGKPIGKKYMQGLFVDMTAPLSRCENVIIIKNGLPYSSFCTDKKKLAEVYAHGVLQARSLSAGTYNK